MKRPLIFFTIILAVFTLFSGVTFAQDPFDAVCTGSGSSSSVCQQKGVTQNPLFGASGVITKVAQILVIIAGVASVFMIMIGGFKYMTSAGDSAKISSAKDTILYAIIGLIVTVFAQSIVTYVLTRL